MIRMPPTFSTRPRWRACSGRLVWADPYHPRLEIYELAGRLLQVIDLARTRRRVTAEDRAQFAQAAAARWDLDQRGTADLQQSDTFTDWIPVTGTVVCGTDGGFWVNYFDPSVPEFREAVGPQWDIVDGAGQASTHVVFPPGFVLTFVAPKYAYGIARRELDVSVVEVYRTAGTS